MAPFFYDTFSDCYSKFNVHGPKFILGDFNVWLYVKRSGEEGISEKNVFGKPLVADACLCIFVCVFV